MQNSRKPSDAPPDRMRALAKLPVFLDIAGKRAIVAGGTAPAAWKAELLAAAGADVAVHARDLSPEMQALVARGAASGSVTHQASSWTPDVLIGAAIALADAEDEAEARAFVAAAKIAGVPANVIDKPEFCQFQFGSIVNRSPVIVSVSTDGGAPILGQAIRRRIETLLPPSLSEWAILAKSVRERVGNKLKPGIERRTFWERFSDRAFQTEPPAQALGEVNALISEVNGVASTARAGRVTLVGAGPGDAELLTLKAVRALQSADIILYDDLVSADVLELARREAKRMMVGKRGGRQSCKQDDINALMIKLAHQGKHVVRLKSGDPLIFGRAGEEIGDLRKSGIPVAVVPGITSASAMAANLGVSLTHRDCAQSLRFVTGHTKSGELPDALDWHGLADPATTLIVYMGGRTSEKLAGRLLAEGRRSDTPVVIAESISRPEQNVTRLTLGALALGLAAHSVSSTAPVLIGIGAVFADRQCIDDRRHSTLGAPEMVTQALQAI